MAEQGSQFSLFPGVAFTANQTISPEIPAEQFVYSYASPKLTLIDQTDGTDLTTDSSEWQAAIIEGMATNEHLSKSIRMYKKQDTRYRCIM